MRMGDAKMINPVPLQCEVCERRWELRLELPMPAREFCRVMATATCPTCGAGSQDIGIVGDDDENAIFE